MTRLGRSKVDPNTMVGARLDSLTGVRFVAALVVFLYHAGYYLPANELGIFGAGMTGVSLFYILSGFVLAWAFRIDDRPSLFYRRRFARIYPAYFVAVTAAITVSFVMRDFSAAELTAYTLLQSWSPDPSVHYATSPVFWSLSCEAFFYIVFPVIAANMSRSTSRTLWGIVCAGVAAVIAIGAVSSFYWDVEMVRWLAYIFPPTRLVEFSIGIALGFIARRGFRSPLPVWAASLLSLSAVLMASLAPSGLRIASITIVPFAILVLSLASTRASQSRKGFSNKALVELGVWSYCFYLIHAMIQGWVVKAGEVIGLSAPFSILFSLVIGIVGAWALHALVERPAERWLRPARSVPRLDSD
jgi:peptidoglycan/LPS O-acetylase OafA/YrhL